MQFLAPFLALFTTQDVTRSYEQGAVRIDSSMQIPGGV